MYNKNNCRNDCIRNALDRNWEIQETWERKKIQKYKIYLESVWYGKIYKIDTWIFKNIAKKSSV